MTSRTQRLGQDLTADLLLDLADENHVSTLTQVRPPQTDQVEVDRAGSPFLETTVFLAPGSWRRPAVEFTSTVVSLTAGPLRVRASR